MQQGVKQNIKKNASYFLTMTVVDWIDVFTRENHKKTLLESLLYCIENKGLNVFAYCLMTNHLHLIVNTNEPFELKDTIRDFKKFTTKAILNQILTEPESRREWMLEAFAKNAKTSAKHKNYKLWQTGNHAIEVYSPNFLWDKINYIHNNPVKDGFVQNPEDWNYSSASNYVNGTGILETVECVQRQWKTY